MWRVRFFWGGMDFLITWAMFVQDKLLSEMRNVALSPDVITYTSLVQNCASQILKSRGLIGRLPCVLIPSGND